MKAADKVKGFLVSLGILILYFGLYPVLVISGSIYLGRLIVEMFKEEKKDGKSRDN